MDLIYTAGHTGALEYTTEALAMAGRRFTPCPDSAVTHLLLPVPSFNPDGTIQGGGSLIEVLSSLPKDITVIGGNLDRPELAGYRTADLLQDAQYIASNAAITAHCALAIAMERLPVTLHRCPVLIIGWGRIGKCLARLLSGLGADITVAARKETDRAMASALGFRAVDTAHITPRRYRLLYNTVPHMLLPDCPGIGLKIDLASQRGIGGEDVIWARGLPGKDAPESSGALIAETILRKGILS